MLHSIGGTTMKTMACVLGFALALSFAPAVCAQPSENEQKVRELIKDLKGEDTIARRRDLGSHPLRRCPARGSTGDLVLGRLVLLRIPSL
jgi:hypothetical protein